MQISYTASDEAIISLYFDRDERAIAETDRKYRRHLFVIAYNIVSDAEDSEECVSDTYLQTWNAIPPHRPKHLRAFLTKITRRLALDIHRKKIRRQTHTERLSDLTFGARRISFPAGRS